MTIDLSVLTQDTRNWAQNTSTASVTLTDTGRTLTGTAAAAYLFGQTLRTVTFDYNADGLQLTDGRFEFPPGSGQPVTLAEVADALRYKYGVDPLIEFAPGLGVRGYSVADINRILEALNREFADDFSLTLIDSTAVKSATQLTAASPASFTVAGSATDTTAESITFENDPDWKSGTPVRVSTTGGGLTAGVDYFVRNLTGGKYEFYTDQTEASGTATTTRVNLTGNIAASVLPRSYSPATATDTTADTVTFVTDPAWTSGTPVRVSTTGGGLTEGVDYFVRNLTGGKYAFYTDQADASGTATSGRVNLTGEVSEEVVPRSYDGILDKDDGQAGTNGVNGTITMSPAPGWATGTRVQLSATGGGLDKDTDYFVRDLTGGKYEFYTSQAAASGAVTANRVNLDANISRTLTPSPSSATVDGDWVTFSDNPQWATGTRVQASTTGGGLAAGVDYFVRALTGGKYALFTDQTAAEGTGTAGQVPLTANNVALTLTPSPSSATVDDDWVTFASNPNWVTGTPVQVSASGGGLDADTVYFVRNLGNGRYDFFTSQGAALGTSSTGHRVDLTGPIGAVSPSYSTAALDTLLNTASTPILAAATETELRQSLTDGGDLYTDRFGAFYLNGVRTQAMDVAVTSRLLVQDNVSAEYKVLMDELAERNNLIAAARVATESISSSEGMSQQARSDNLLSTVQSLNAQYGFTDAISELTAGQVTMAKITSTAPHLSDVKTYLDQLKVKAQALADFYATAITDTNIRKARYLLEFGSTNPSYLKTLSLNNKYAGYREAILDGIEAINTLSSAAGADDYAGFQTAITTAKTVYSKSDIFAWLRSFDVSGSLLWARDQNSIIFKGQTYEWNSFPAHLGGQSWRPYNDDHPLTTYEIIAGPTTGSNAVDAVYGYPPAPFDWNSNDWGWTSNYFTTTKSTQYFPTRPNTYLWDWAEQVSAGILNGSELNESGVATSNMSLMSLMRLAECSYDEVIEYYNTSSSSSNQKIDSVNSWFAAMQINFPGVPSAQWGSLFEVFDWGQWQAGTETSMDRLTSWAAYKDAGAGYIDSGFFNVVPPVDQSDYPKITALLNTLISNKVRDGDLDQAKLQTLTAQLQNNTEAMTALIKAFTDMNAQLARAL